LRWACPYLFFLFLGWIKNHTHRRAPPTVKLYHNFWESVIALPPFQELHRMQKCLLILMVFLWICFRMSFSTYKFQILRWAYPYLFFLFLGWIKNHTHRRALPTVKLYHNFWESAIALPLSQELHRMQSCLLILMVFLWICLRMSFSADKFQILRWAYPYLFFLFLGWIKNHTHRRAPPTVKLYHNFWESAIAIPPFQELHRM
jgi:hypothetical protein